MKRIAFAAVFLVLLPGCQLFERGEDGAPSWFERHALPAFRGAVEGAASAAIASQVDEIAERTGARVDTSFSGTVDAIAERAGAPSEIPWGDLILFGLGLAGLPVAMQALSHQKLKNALNGHGTATTRE